MNGLVWWRRACVVGTVLGLVGCGSGGSPPTAPEKGGSLVGPTWSLTTLAGQPILEGTRLTAEFSGEDRVAGNAGCNSFFGRARVEAGRLAVGPLGSTLMACERPGVMEQEGRYLASLEAATSYTLSGDQLRLGPWAGEVTLVFTSR
jgi:heat shock protein HslJ